jgi:protein-tyrosine phosphatase
MAGEMKAPRPGPLRIITTLTLSRIRPYLWVTDFDTVCEQQVRDLQSLGARCIINVGDQDHTIGCKTLWKANGIKYRYYKTIERARTDMLQRGSTVHDLIEEGRAAGYGTILHCVAGKNRSVICAMFHLMLAEDLTPHQAFCDVHDLRPGIQPLPAFYTQLQRFTSARLKDLETPRASLTSECLSPIAPSG